MSEDEIGVDVVIENEEGSIDIQSDVLKGDKGDKGDPTATIEINQVLTGEAGTEAKIDNIGTDVNMKLNITIPRGDTGEQGEQGYTPIKGTDYFTNEEIQQIKNKVLDEVNQFSVVVVSELPEENINDKTIYLVPKEAGEGDNIYSEYIYVSGKWELIGSTEIDASKLTVNLVENSYEVIITETVEANGIITIPAYYKVDTDRLDVYLNGDKLVKAEESDTEGHYYEVGTKGELSNTIQITSDWKPDISDVFEFVIRTNGQGAEVETDTMIVSSTEPSTKQKVWLQKGKNLLQKLTDSTTVYGVTGVNNTDGSLSVTGTSTTSGNLYLIALKKIDVIDIAEGQYIISLNNVDIVETGFIRLRKYNGTEKVAIDTFPIDEVNKIRLIDLKSLIDSDTIRVEMDIVCSGINTFNFIVYPQIQAGNIPTEYEEYIEPKIYVKNDNGVYEEFISKDDNLQIYSTEERVIGKWIDGKTLYRKTITYTPSDKIGEEGKVTDIYIPHGISDFNQLCGQKCTTSDGYILPTLGSKDNTILNYGTCIRAVTTETINIRLVNDAWGVRTWYITLEYTKATD